MPPLHVVRHTVPCEAMVLRLAFLSGMPVTYGRLLSGNCSLGEAPHYNSVIEFLKDCTRHYETMIHALFPKARVVADKSRILNPATFSVDGQRGLPGSALLAGNLYVANGP